MAQNYIDRFLKKQGSPLAGLGGTFIQAGKKYGVDPRLLVAITGAESSFGKHNYGKFNPFGWGPGINFSSWADAINTVAKGLRSGYLDEGRTSIPKIGQKWAPIGAGNDPTNLNSNWVKNVQKFYGMLKGRNVGSAGTSPGGVDMASLGSSGLPDAAAIAQSFLQGISSGQDYDPLAQLEQLAQLPPPGQDVAVDPSTGLAGGMDLKAGGGWGGSKGIASSLINGLGLTVTSTKRDTKSTASGGVSDHWSGNKNAFAYDVGGSVAAMDRAAVALARRLGVNYKKGQPLVVTVNRGGYRIQALYRTDTGGNHWDHLHIGVKRL